MQPCKQLLFLLWWWTKLQLCQESHWTKSENTDAGFFWESQKFWITIGLSLWWKKWRCFLHCSCGMFARKGVTCCNIHCSNNRKLSPNDCSLKHLRSHAVLHGSCVEQCDECHLHNQEKNGPLTESPIEMNESNEVEPERWVNFDVNINVDVAHKTQFSGNFFHWTPSMTFVMFKNAMIICKRRHGLPFYFITEHSNSQFASAPKNSSTHQQLHPSFTSVTDQILTEEQFFVEVQQSLQNCHAEFFKENKDKENKEIGMEGMVSFPNIDNRKKTSNWNLQVHHQLKKQKRALLKWNAFAFIS